MSAALARRVPDNEPAGKMCLAGTALGAAPGAALGTVPGTMLACVPADGYMGCGAGRGAGPGAGRAAKDRAVGRGVGRAACRAKLAADNADAALPSGKGVTGEGAGACVGAGDAGETGDDGAGDGATCTGPGTGPGPTIGPGPALSTGAGPAPGSVPAMPTRASTGEVPAPASRGRAYPALVVAWSPRILHDRGSAPVLLLTSLGPALAAVCAAGLLGTMARTGACLRASCMRRASAAAAGTDDVSASPASLCNVADEAPLPWSLSAPNCGPELLPAP
jgi:hypothetical protein